MSKRMPKPTQCRVESDAKGHPRLVSFPSGVPSESLNFTFKTNGLTGKKHKAALEGDLDGLVFVEKESVGSTDKLYKYAIARLNASGDKLVIYPTEHNYVMRANIGAEVAPAEHSGLTAAERREQITEEFGSSKKKRAVKQAASNVIQETSVVGAKAVGSTMDEITTNVMEAGEGVTIVDDTLEEQRKKILPPFNTDADSPEDIYPINDLLPRELKHALGEVFDSLVPEGLDEEERKGSLDAIRENMQKSLQERSEASSKNCSSTVVESLEAAVSTVAAQHDDSEEFKAWQKSFKQRCLSVLLMHFMILFYGVLSEQRAKTMPLSAMETALGAPQKVLEHLVAKFAVSTNRKMGASIKLDKSGQDSLFSYLLALGLHTSDFSFAFSRLATDLKVSDIIMGKVARNMGLKTVKSKTGGPNTFHFNKVPIEFPAPPRGKSTK